VSGLRIVIIAKAPAPGLAKTRLIPALGPERAALLARRMLLHTVREARAAAVGAVELCVSPSVGDPLWATLDPLPEVVWSEQVQGDLGARMTDVAARTLASDQRVVLVGTDCPELQAEDFRAAASALENHDSALRPTADGGYALLALRRFHASLFEDIPWSTGEVAHITLARLSGLGWTVHLGAQVHDIDEPGDLAWLPPGWDPRENSACKHSPGVRDSLATD